MAKYVFGLALLLGALAGYHLLSDKAEPVSSAVAENDVGQPTEALAQAAAPVTPAAPVDQPRAAIEKKPLPAATEQAIQQIGEAGQFALVIVTDSTRKGSERALQDMRQVAEEFVASKAGRVEPLLLDRASADAASLVQQYGLDRAPLPLTLMFAPNGAVTGGFPQRVSAEQLEGTLVSRTSMDMMKHLQEGRLLFLCVRGTQTTGNDEADSGIRAFAKTSGMEPAIVQMDPADQAEVDLLKQLRVDPTTDKAVTLMLAPPGRLIGRFDGPVTDQQIVLAIQMAQRSSCGDASCTDTSCPPAQ